MGLSHPFSSGLCLQRIFRFCQCLLSNEHSSACPTWSRQIINLSCSALDGLGTGHGGLQRNAGHVM